MSNLNKEIYMGEKCGMIIYYEYRFICMVDVMPTHPPNTGVRHERDRITFELLAFVF